MAQPSTDAEMVTAIRHIINEPTALLFSDTDLTNWADEATEVMSQASLCREEADVGFSLTLNTFDYTYSTVFSSDNYPIKVESMIWMNGASDNGVVGSGARALLKISPRLYKHLDDGTSGEPKYWCDFGGSIHIWPKPAAGQDATFVRVLYYMAIDTDDVTLSGATATWELLPAHLREYVIWYVLSKAYEYLGKYAQSEQYLSYFYNFIMFHRQDRLYKPVDSKDMMKLPDYTQIAQQ